MAYDPQDDKYDYPEYTDPNLQPFIDAIAGLQGQAYDLMPPNVAGMIPWGRGQMEDWFTKMFTGQRGKKVGAEYEQRSTDQLDRFATGEIARRKTQQAEAGGRGSSESARMMAESKGQYFDARDTIGLNRLNIEEKIRGEDFGRGMGGVSALQSIIRGDYSDALSAAQFGQAQTGLEADLINSMANMGLTEAQMNNIWNQWRYSIEHGGAEMGSGVNVQSPWGGFSF